MSSSVNVLVCHNYHEETRIEQHTKKIEYKIYEIRSNARNNSCIDPITFQKFDSKFYSKVVFGPCRPHRTQTMLHPMSGPSRGTLWPTLIRHSNITVNVGENRRSSIS